MACLVLVLFLPSDSLLAANHTDMVHQWVASRAFLVDSLRHGHLPLWNPFTYAGQPFLGDFEEGVLYPLNLFFLVLPLAAALNFFMLIHLVILGWGMERWATHRGLSPWAAGLAGFVMPLSGAVFPHVYAGHLPSLATMAWAPWIFLGFEMWTGSGDRRGLFLASAAICLQLLAGHVQYFFYTAVAVGIQALVLSVAEPAARRRAIPAAVGCYLAASVLGAPQLLTGLSALSEGIRQQKLDYDLAAMFGFPQENFLTAIAPGFFGNLSGAPDYWGRSYLWEMSLFIGAVGPLLIAIALGDAGRRRRVALLDLIVAGVLLVLALGVHTPVFDLLYRFVPGFGQFRSWSKFIFPATLFFVLVMASGADVLLRGKSVSRAIAWGGLLAGSIAAGASLVLFFSPQAITGFLNFILTSQESYLPAATFADPDFVHEAGIHAGLSLGLAGVILIAAGASLLLSHKQPLLRWALPALLMAEMIGFAASQIAVSNISDAMPDSLRQFVANHPGDYRVLDLAYPDNGFLLGAGDLGGVNPAPLRRYAEFITFTQGADPDHPTQNLPFKSSPRIYAMLRLRYAFVRDSRGIRLVKRATPPLPRVLLVHGERVLSGRDAIFSAMHDRRFDPSKTVLLEEQPEPHPESDAQGTVKLDSVLPGELVVEAETSKPALLLITDLYDRNWRAEALPDSSQRSYHVMPADYVLRAVPLAAGRHHLRIVYAPPAFPIGVGISAVGWILWIGFLIFTRPAGRPSQG